MKDLRKNITAFTMLELLIVIVILGIIAGLAIPVYTAQTVKSYKQEAYQNLTAARKGALEYFAEQTTPTYAGMTEAQMGDPDNPAGGQIRHFSYAITTQTATDLLLTADCVNAAGAVAGTSAAIPGCTPGTDTITIDEEGTIDPNGIFA